MKNETSKLSVVKHYQRKYSETIMSTNLLSFVENI